MKKTDMLKYVIHCLDDALNVRSYWELQEADFDRVRLVGWQVGFEPVFVAVWSYLPNVTLTAEDAEEIATDYLIERKWFADGPFPATWVL